MGNLEAEPCSGILTRFFGSCIPGDGEQVCKAVCVECWGSLTQGLNTQDAVRVCVCV